MRQGILPFRVEAASETRNIVDHGGLCLYLELLCANGMLASVREHVRVCSEDQGWSDEQMVLALVCLNLAGGECVDDLRMLEADRGLGRLLRLAEQHHLTGAQRRLEDKRWRKGRTQHLPSASSVFRFLSKFDEPAQNQLRRSGKAFIPAATAPLAGLARVNADALSFLQRFRPQRVATLDVDATVVPTYKRDALFCYQSCRAYQPMNVFWAEQQAIVHSEFRDGNVPAGYEQLRVLQQALSYLPDGVQTVQLRSDTAGYQHDLLHWCATGKSERFGVIEFAVGCPITQEFRNAVKQISEKEWRPLTADVNGGQGHGAREWAAVPLYVPGATARSKSDPDYTYFATREALLQQPLPGTAEQMDLPFQTVELGGAGQERTYKLFGAVTNKTCAGDELIRWLYERCGKSEEVHSIQKEDLAGGQLPSAAFGANAAWWAIMVLAFNLNVMMKRLVLRHEWANRRMKALRYHFIDVAGMLLTHAGQLVLRLAAPAQTVTGFIDGRRRIRRLLRPAPT